MSDHARTASRPLAASLALLSVTTAAATASAQTSGWALDRFEPAPSGDSFFVVEHSRSRPGSAATLNVGLAADYALRPLVFTATGSAMASAVVDHHVAMRLQASGEVAQRVGINFDLPVAVPFGGALRGAVAGGVRDGFAVGDPRFGLRLRIAGLADRDPLSVSVGAQAFMGFLLSSGRDQLVTDDALRGRLYLALGGRGGPVRWAFTGGYHARPRLDLARALDPSASAGPLIASEVYASAGVSWVLLAERLSLGVEGWVQTPAERMFSASNVAAELLASARFKPAPWVELALGLGPGLTRAVGTPALRGALSVTFLAFDRATPPPRADTAATDGARVTVSTEAASVTAQRATAPQRTESDPCPLGESCDPAALDRDNDGVLAPIDQCPAQPAGATPDPSRAGCPDPDRDGDSQPDHRDACPDEPSGARPDPLRLGCPLVDRDNDNVADPVDHCPDQPGAPSTDPNRNGCPSLVRLDTGSLRILEQVYFDTNRATIQPRSFLLLQAVVDAMRARTDVRRISVEGHTDDRGDAERNVDLSVRRATAVMLWLTAHGVEPERLEAHGFGPTRPVVPNRSAQDRERNRRVEFRVVDPAQPASGATP